jgi:hypothetical protein
MSARNSAFHGGSKSHLDKSNNSYKFDIGTAVYDNESTYDMSIEDYPHRNNWHFDDDYGLLYFRSRSKDNSGY